MAKALPNTKKINGWWCSENLRVFHDITVRYITGEAGDTDMENAAIQYMIKTFKKSKIEKESSRFTRWSSTLKEVSHLDCDKILMQELQKRMKT